MAGKKKYSDEFRNAVVASLQSGKTVAKVAREFGLPYTTVMCWNNDIGKPAPQAYFRGTPDKPHPKKAEAIRRVEQGEDKTKVALALGVSGGTVSVWTKHIPDKRKVSLENNQVLIERVKSGESISSACRALGISISHANTLLENLDIALTESQQNAVLSALSEGLKVPEIALSLNLPQRAIYAFSGIKKYKSYTQEEQQKAIKLIESGVTVSEIEKSTGISHYTLRRWHEKAVKDGKASRPTIIKAKVNDQECLWITRISPELEQWRCLVVRWLEGEVKSYSRALDAIISLIERYIVGQGLPRDPASLLSKGMMFPDFYRTVCSDSPQGVMRNNTVHRLLNWVLKTPDFADQDDDGEWVTLPSFRNPISMRDMQGMTLHLSSSNKTVMPYWHIHDLRRRIAAGKNFQDWTWVHLLLGNPGLDGTKAGPDWFPVDESLIDLSDPDCVWRKRYRVKADPIVEMWSPVRWVALLVKLQITARMGQIRMLDSGEADTNIFRDGKFIQNDGLLAHGSVKNPRQQGVLRQPMANDSLPIVLYLNTNKTADIGKFGKDKGMICPWPQSTEYADDPYYWLNKLILWQAKYNPISKLTSWNELTAQRQLSTKHALVNAEYPDTAFLFRTPETPTEATLPVAASWVHYAWCSLLKDYQNILHEQGTTYPDGSQIRYVDPESGNALITLHGLRVSLITHLIIDGNMPPELMMKIVGHARFIMTVYYCKPGLASLHDALTEATVKLDATKDATLSRHLANLSEEQIRDFVVFSAEDWTTVLSVNPADRNPIGWLPMHMGFCLAGGNTGPLDGDASVPGCHNGGPMSKARPRPVFGPVEGGIRNCTRCRWLCAGKQHISGLVATLNNRQYHLYKQGDKALEAENIRNNLLKNKAHDEALGKPFSYAGELRQSERLFEAAMLRLTELARDIVALNKLIERVKSLPDHDDGALALALQGDNVTLNTILEETNNELLVLAQICEDVEFFPDLDPGTAVFEFSQLLDLAIEREGHPMVFARMSEGEKLIAANAFMRTLEKSVNPHNSLLARREVVQVLDRGESLQQLLNIDLASLLPSDISYQGVSKRLVHKESENDPQR